LWSLHGLWSHDAPGVTAGGEPAGYCATPGETGWVGIAATGTLP